MALTAEEQAALDAANKEKKFTQADVDALVGSTRQEATANATKKVLKDIGVETVEAAKARVSKAAELEAAGMTEADRLKTATAAAEARALQAEKDSEAAKLSANTALLHTEAITVGGDLGLAPAKAKQILKLLDVDPGSFDKAKPGIKEKFDAFLALPENKHFLDESGGTPETAGRQPARRGGVDKADPFAKLKSQVTVVKL